MPHIAHHNRSRLYEIEQRIVKYTSLTKVVLAMAIIEPLMTLPQVHGIWINKETAGVSLLTWSFYIFAAIIWLFYGLKIKDRPLIIASTLWVIVEISIVIGLLLFG